ncbi:substrate-binding domain-containing protein [Robbsia sp. Bb-Pol-6]|uniref:Substrate-binding domain-containing protein n=1 Tax=Robbsia betulipollinis TaxID=2981849 RepID=A0ABT3ZKY1_9BURK|nr:substrate-binding domain-containing protein [Robbsia betulipollinis]MCY0386600.1 substrate-binding domain-containing protein [Robbsia betulipollinis]
MIAKKRFRLRVLVGLVSFGLLGCGFAVAAPVPKLALVQINQEALFFTQMNAGAQAAAKAAGAQLSIYNANNDPSAQANAIETYIQQKVDAILVVAIDVNGIKPAIAEAKKAGIPVITIDSIVQGDNAVQVGVDNKKVSESIGKLSADYASKNLHGHAQVGVVGALNSYIQNVRADGFKAGLAAAPGSRIVATVDGQNVQDQAQSASESLITAHPDLQIVYATGEPALIGVVAASMAQGGTPPYKVMGWDLSSQAIAGLDSGLVLAVVQQSGMGEGTAAVQAAMKLIAHQAVPKNVSVPVTIVTKANVDQFRAQFK